MRKYSFAAQVQIAKEIEDKLLEYYATLKEYVNVVDVRYDKDFQGMDIDFMLVKEDNPHFNFEMLEVKADFKTHKTGNLFIELGEKGWLNKTRCDRLLYVDVENKVGYYIHCFYLKEYIHENKGELVEKQVGTTDFGGFITTGVLLPIDSIKDEDWVTTINLTKVL